MRRENKEVIIDSITNLLNTSANLYVTDLEALNAEKTSQLRRLCFNSQVKLVVVKNALLKKLWKEQVRIMVIFIQFLKEPPLLCCLKMATHRQN